MFKEIQVKDLSFNPFTSLQEDWALLSAKNSENKVNSMTVSWGGVGAIFNENVITVYVRPQRYTRSFIDETGNISLSFFNGEYKKELAYLGAKSGKDEDKLSLQNFKPIFFGDFPAVDKAKLVICAKVIYKGEIFPQNFIKNNEVDYDKKWYENKDYHYVYLAKIEKIYVSD